MPATPLHRTTRLAAAAAVLTALAGCNAVVMNPSGDIARQQADLIFKSTLLMLLIIVPVIALTLLFAWRYRAANREAAYQPDWDHSTKLELVIWGAPLLIVIALGAITWLSTHQLDPYRPLSRLHENRPLLTSDKTLEVQVVALDWKWLFIYPEQGIATVNELAAPVNRQIRFRMTSSTVMNSLFIPALAGQIYAMPGMQTQLHAVINEPGVYEGFSANYSGGGFSQMRFKFHGVSDAEFQDWVAKARASGAVLDRAAYLQLERPSIADPVKLFGGVERELFTAAVNRCVDAGRMCMGEMMAIDAAGGGGKVGLANLARQPWRDGEALVVAGQCTPTDIEGRGASVLRPVAPVTNRPTTDL